MRLYIKRIDQRDSLIFRFSLTILHVGNLRGVNNMKCRHKLFFGAAAALVLFFIAGCAGTNEAVVVETAPAATAAATRVEIVDIPMIQKESSYIGEDFLETEKVFTWENDRLAEVVVTDSFGDPIEHMSYEYSDADNRVKRFTYDPDQKLQSLSISLNNSDGLLVSHELYNRNEELQTISDYTYDSEGNRIRWDVKDSSGNLMAYSEYSYENGVVVRIDTFAADGTLRDHFVREVQAGKVMVEKSFDQKGVASGKIEFAYSGDNVVSKTFYRANGSRERIVEYEYDDKGSAVKEVYLRADETVEQVITREFSYRQEERVVAQ